MLIEQQQTKFYMFNLGFHGGGNPIFVVEYFGKFVCWVEFQDNAEQKETSGRI